MKTKYLMISAFVFLISGLAMIATCILMPPTTVTTVIGFLMIAGSVVGFSLWASTMIDTLASETRNAFSEQNQKFIGLRDHFTSIEKEIDCFRKDLAEYEKTFSEDERTRMLSRIGMLELKVGITRQGPVVSYPLGQSAKSS